MMANPRATVTQAETRRCLKAARDAGYDEARVEIERPDGTKLSICAGKAGEAATETDDIDAMIERVP